MNSKVQKLSKEKKLELLEAVREKKRRLKNQRPQFYPHPGQLEVLQATETVDNVYLFCGNGWGKTGTGSNLAIWWAKGYNPVLDIYYNVPETITIVLDHPSKVEDVWLPEMRKWTDITDDMVKKNGKPYPNEITWPNGSRVKFMFHEQPTLVWESTQFSKVIFDEPPPRHVIIGIRRGMREKGKDPKLAVLGTPISQGWLRKDILKPWEKGELKNTKIFFGHTSENEANLRDGYMEEFTQYLTEDEKRSRLAGEFFNAGSLPLEALLDRKIHVIGESTFSSLFDKDRDPCVIAIDPHQSKKNVAVLLGCDQAGNLYYIDEIARKEVPRRYAKYVKQWQSEYRVVDVVWDSSGQAEGTGAEGYLSFSDVMREEGIQGRATSKQDKSDERFVERIQEALFIPELPDRYGNYLPKLRIVSGNTGILDDIENVGWQLDSKTKEAKPKLEISNRDFLAALKYALACNLTPLKGRERVVKRAAKTKAYGFGKKKRRYV